MALKTIEIHMTRTMRCVEVSNEASASFFARDGYSFVQGTEGVLVMHEKMSVAHLVSWGTIIYTVQELPVAEQPTVKK